MNNDRLLPLPAGFDPATQHTVGILVASLEDQAARLKKLVADWPVAAFEWQPHAGCNTAGMLIAHNAFVEVAWICVSASGLSYGPEGKARVMELVGHDWDDDGMPMKAGDTPPEALRGRDVAFYRDLLDKARAAVVADLRSWTDASLEQTFTTKWGTISRGWTLYHILEHYAQHFGQVSMLGHLMRDAGVLPPRE
jgi:hypothetical protein